MHNFYTNHAHIFTDLCIHLSGDSLYHIFKTTCMSDHATIKCFYANGLDDMTNSCI